MNYFLKQYGQYFEEHEYYDFYLLIYKILFKLEQ